MNFVLSSHYMKVKTNPVAVCTWVLILHSKNVSKVPRGPLLLLSVFLRIFFLLPISAFCLTEESCRPPGYAQHHFNLSTLLCLQAHPLPSATVAVILCEAPVIMDTDAGPSVHAEGPSTWSWIPAFTAEGRISFSKCLAGKYVTGLETDPVKNRRDIFKPTTGVCVCVFTPEGEGCRTPAGQCIVCQV